MSHAQSRQKWRVPYGNLKQILHMKYISAIIIFALSFMLISCGKNQGYRISGEVSNVEGNGIAILQNFNTGKQDTVTYLNGKFNFSGELKEPGLYKLLLAAPEDSFGFQMKTDLLYLENEAISVSGNHNELYDSDNRNYATKKRIIIKGSYLNDLYNNYLELVRPFVKEAATLSDEILLDTIAVENMTDRYLDMMLSKQSRLNDLQHKRDSIKNLFIINHPNTKLAYDFVYATLISEVKYKAVFDESVAHGVLYSKVMDLPTASEVNGWLSLLKEQNVFSTSQLQVLDSLWAKKKQITKGAPFINAQIRNIKGEKVSLKDQLSKDGYTLIDCWASWCMPCRWFIPHLKQIHNKYQEKGLKIISISIDNYDKEREKEAWYNAMKEEDMPWQQFQTNKKSSFVASYGVYSIPNIILIDASNQIVATDIRGLDLDLLLQSIYNE